jgi:hypothetical protein
VARRTSGKQLLAVIDIGSEGGRTGANESADECARNH